MKAAPVLELREAGLYCPAGDFFIDPWRPVEHGRPIERAVITHAHSDHARAGCQAYLAEASGVPILKHRVGNAARFQAIGYGDTIRLGDAKVSLHPAGHILGSSQVRVEVAGEVWCVTGDYKAGRDRTCVPYEPVRCHTLITESTFGLPIYRWPDPATVFTDIHRWWADNQSQGRTSILMGYSLGKAQRLLGGLDPTQGPIYAHGAVLPLNELYRQAGISLPETLPIPDARRATDYSTALVMAPPSVQGTPWLGRFGDVSLAFASGWMTIRGWRRRQVLDRGFVLSDHVDWPELLQAISDSAAERVLVTHGYAATVVRWLQSQGLDAETLATRFVGDSADEQPAEVSPADETSTSRTDFPADDSLQTKADA